MKRIFIIECDILSKNDFDLIHRYIRQRLEPKNKYFKIETFITARKGGY